MGRIVAPTLTEEETHMKFSNHAAVTLALIMAASAASAQTWEYKNYPKDRVRGYSKDNFIVSSVSLEEKDGKHFFRLATFFNDPCYLGAIPAEVTKTDETTVIELKHSIAGCERVRYVIRNDGSGGQREGWRGDAWKASPFDHGLKPVAK
jgi:hypothetical protein